MLLKKVSVKLSCVLSDRLIWKHGTFTVVALFGDVTVTLDISTSKTPQLATRSTDNFYFSFGFSGAFLS